MKYMGTAGIAKMESTIKRLARFEASARKDNMQAWADEHRCERVGMINLANELGVHCGCAETPKTEAGTEDCVCATTLRTMHARLRRLPGRGTGKRRGIITLAGDERPGCRDAQGKFVPVSQCNPAQYAGRWIMLPE